MDKVDLVYTLLFMNKHDWSNRHESLSALAKKKNEQMSS